MNIEKIIKDINTITSEIDRCTTCQVGNNCHFSDNEKLIQEIIDEHWQSNNCCIGYFIEENVPIRIIKQIIDKKLLYNLCDDDKLEKKKEKIIKFFESIGTKLSIE